MREIPITMTNFEFAPKTVTVRPGERVRFVMDNVSDQDHEFESDQARFEEVIVPPHRDRSSTWTAPTRPGEYLFVCDIAGHEGMEMTVRVAEAG